MVRAVPSPGWVLFVDSLPTTGTQKAQIFLPGTGPCHELGAIDLRGMKKRQ